MAKGIVHQRWWKRVLPLSLIFSACLMLLSPIVGIMCFVGYVLGRFIEPDLDQLSLTISEGDMMRKFGCIGMFWVMYWFPYSFFIPHRSPVSHMPGLSDAIRMAYLFWWFAPLLTYYNITLSYEIPFGLWIGLTISTFVHWSLDK